MAQKWKECLCDFAGNRINPGHSADLWEVDGRQMLALQGAWSYYDQRFQDEWVDYWFDVTDWLDQPGNTVNLLSDILNDSIFKAVDLFLTLPRVDPS